MQEMAFFVHIILISITRKECVTGESVERK